MKLGWMTSAALALGVSAAVPSLTKADDWRDSHRDRDYPRHDYDRDRADVYDVSLRDVPGRVMDRVDDYRHGRRIERAQFVRDHGHAFYQFRIDDRRNGDFTLQIESDGHLIARIDSR